MEDMEHELAQEEAAWRDEKRELPKESCSCRLEPLDS